MIKKILSWLLGIAAVLVAAAYIYPPGKIELRRRGAETDSTLRAIESLHSELGKIPPLAPGDTGFIQPGLTRKVAPEYTAFVHAEDLTDLSAEAPIPLRFCESRVKQAAYLARNLRWRPDEKLNPFFDTPAFMDENIDYLKGLKHLFVIRRQSYTAPKLAKMGGFESGDYSGDVLLFEIPTRKLLGHFWISGSNGNWIESHETPERAILTDLGSKVNASLDEAVKGSFPGFADSARVNGPCSLH
jgi:hypothetical protein